MKCNVICLARRVLTMLRLLIALHASNVAGDGSYDPKPLPPYPLRGSDPVILGRAFAAQWR